MKRMTTVVLAGLLATTALPVFAQDEEPTQLEITIPALADGETLEGEFDGTSSAQLFVFNATEGDEVTVAVTQDADSGLDPYIVLLGPTGEVIAQDDDSGEESLSSLIDGVELPVTGSYFVLVSSYGSIMPFGSTEVDNIEGAFSITAEGITNPDAESDQSLFGIYPLEVGETLEVETTDEAPVAYGVFSAAEGDEVSISAVASDVDAALMVFAPNGARIAVVDDGDLGIDPSVEGLEIPADGGYLVFVSERTFTSGPDIAVASTYEITVE